MLELKSISKQLKKIEFSLFSVLLITTLSFPLRGLSQSQPDASFSSNLYNIENTTKETFRYSTTLKNNTKEARMYQLKADIPDGWRASFKSRGSNITSINVESKKTESISVEIKPAYECEPAKYEIPITATSEFDTLGFVLEAVVKGNYDVQLTTPTGLLSGKVTEGKKKEIALKIKNTGTLPLSDLDLSSRTPSKWEATFSPSSIDLLEPGKSYDATVTLSIPDKTLPGDYIANLTVKNADAKSSVDYRTTVQTSILAGWIGILVILIAVGIVVLLIRKFGRR
ncbi:MAG: NEW3 domain-containing protein [Cyclobacteriaceae bacterium]